MMTCMDTFCVRQVESLALMKVNGQTGVTTLQRREHTSGDSAALKWSAIIDLDLDSFDLSRSFQKHYIIYKDTYLKYIQFRTLHHRFFTNERLFKMGIKKSNLCGFFNDHVDSIEHMFLQCEISLELWGSIEDWIRDLSMEKYNLSNSRIVLGDLDNATSINTIILITKKVIYNSMKKKQKTHILNVKI